MCYLYESLISIIVHGCDTVRAARWRPHSQVQQRAASCIETRARRYPYVFRPVRRRRPLSLTWKPIKMAEVVQMFLFLYKSKYRRKGQCREVVRDQCGVIAVPWPILWAALICWVVHVTAAASSSSSSLTTDTTCDTDSCVNGDCVNGTCVCHEGWQGSACQFCGGKVK